MADYRKRLVDMTDEERAEVAPGAPQFSDDYENVGDPLSVQMMEAGLDFTPVGVVRGVSDIKDELSKEDPNYLKALGMAAVEAAGIIPGAAPVAKGMLRKADALTAANKQVSNIEYDARMAQLDEAPDAATWQKNTKKFVKDSRDVNPTVRTPELESSTMDLIDGKITREQHLKNVDQFKPVDPWDALPREPSDKATVFSLKPNQRKDGFFVVSEEAAENLGVIKSALAVGQRFLGRLDIPAYKDYDTWIVAGKSPKGEKGTVYAKAIHYVSADGKPVVFRASQGKSEKIGKGKADPEYTPETHEKTGYATVDGIVQDLDVDSIRAKAAQYLNDPEWTQVGFDPRRQGGFYVRAGENKHVPIREASEVIQIGPLVLARNAKLDFEHTGYAEGGAVMDEQMEMAFGDAGERVDPVSGNEVPTGSLPEEVRDDIPAQLSEGEYVVPADVVRFFGVKFFEDIRNEAKRGFAEMEANGRIGGEPIGMEMAEDELPFDISELQIVDDESEEQPMMNIGGYMRGYADGGLTLPSAVTDMTEATGISGSTSGVAMPAPNLSGIEMREYVGPNGEITYIQFINGVAQSVIPEGYTAKAAAPTTPAVPGGLGVVTPPDDNNNTAHEDMMREAQNRESIDWTSPDVGIEQYEKTLDQNNSMLAKGFSGLATILGGPIVGGFMAIAKRHQNKKMLEGATARLEDPNVKGAERDKWVSIHNRLSGLDEDGKARNSFTEGLANLLTPDDGMEYVNGVLVETATGKVLKPGIANSKGNDVVAPTPTPQSDGSGDSDTNTTAVNAARAAATERSQRITSQDMSGKSTGYKTAAAKKATSGITQGTSSSTAADNTTAGGAALDTSYGISGLNKGGLMKKKKK